MRLRVTLVIAGALAMAYAGIGALADPDLNPVGVLLFLTGVLVGHDLVWMPAVLVAGAVLARLPHRHRTAARVAAISAATVTVIAFPLVLGFGRQADNPSVLPLPYGRNLALVLLVVVGATLLTSRLRGWSRTGRKGSERSAGGGADPAGG